MEFPLRFPLGLCFPLLLLRLPLTRRVYAKSDAHLHWITRTVLLTLFLSLILPYPPSSPISMSWVSRLFHSFLHLSFVWCDWAKTRVLRQGFLRGLLCILNVSGPFFSTARRLAVMMITTSFDLFSYVGCYYYYSGRLPGRSQTWFMTEWA